MRKNILKSSVLASLLSLFLFFSNWKNSSLKDITKPYLGEYECKQATFDGEDYLKEFAYICLDLQKENKFELSYCKKGGKKQKTDGLYEYDKEKELLVFSVEETGGLKKAFPLKNGELLITLFFGDKPLQMKFEQK